MTTRQEVSQEIYFLESNKRSLPFGFGKAHNYKDMKKILIIEDCVHCPYFKRIVIDRKLKDVCFGRNKVAYLANEVESSISKDCPLETAKEESK